MKVYVHILLDGQKPWQERQNVLGRVAGWVEEIERAGHQVLNFDNFGGNPEKATTETLAEAADVVLAFMIEPLIGFGDGEGSMKGWLDLSTKPCALVFESLNEAGSGCHVRPLFCMCAWLLGFVEDIGHAPAFYDYWRHQYQMARS